MHLIHVLLPLTAKLQAQAHLANLPTANARDMQGNVKSSQCKGTRGSPVYSDTRLHMHFECDAISLTSNALEHVRQV